MKAQHNDVYVSHHKVDGWSERKAYIFKAYVNGPKWIPFTTDYGDYLCGYLPPHYPVPAINTLGTPMFEAWLRYTNDVYVCDYTSMLADQGEFD